MSTLGLLAAGALKGYADKKVEYLDAREEEERQKRKAKFLEQLRLDTNKEMADYQEMLAAKRPDEKMSTIDYATGKFTQRDRSGNIISERNLTDAEKSEYERGIQKENLGMEATRAQIRNLDADNARADREEVRREKESSLSRSLTAKQIKALDAEADGKTVGSFDMGRQIVEDYDKVVAGAIRDGVPEDDIARLAARAAANAKARNQGYNTAQQYFLEGLRMYKSGVVAPKNEEDAAKKPTFDQAKARQAINRYRAARGLDQ